MKAIVNIEWGIPVNINFDSIDDAREETYKAYEKAGLPYSDVEIPESVTDPYLKDDDDEDDDDDDDDAVYDAISSWLEKKYGHRVTNIELEWSE